MKKSVAIFAMTTLGLQSVQAGFFDSDFTGISDVDSITGSEFINGQTRVNDVEGMNNILKSLKYLKENATGGKFVDGTTATDAVFTGGNVGIGTNTPEKQLHIYSGDSGVTPTDANVIIEDGNNAVLKLFTPNVSGGFIGFGDPENDQAGLIGYEHDEDYLKIETNGTEKLRITSDGNVGIGTMNPESKLQIVGGGISLGDGEALTTRGLFNIHHTTNPRISITKKNVHGFRIETVGETLGAGRLNIGTDTSIGDENAHMSIQSDGNVGIGTTTPTEKLDVNGNVKATAFIGDGSQLTNLPSGGKFVDGTTATDAVFTGGNVGIGTDSPAFQMELVESDSHYNVKLSSTSSDFVPGILIENDIGDLGVISVGRSALPSQYAGDLVLQAPAENGLLFRTNGNNERLRIDKDGNVGIGTTTPERKLSVVGGEIGLDNAQSFAIKDSAGDYRSVLQMTAADGVHIQNNSGGDGGYIGFFTQAGGFESMRVLADGNVGIGTITPTEKLEVNGNVKATAFIGDGSQLTNLPSGGKFVDGTTATDAKYEAGRVGIGQAPLDAQEVSNDDTYTFGNGEANLQVFNTSDSTDSNTLVLRKTSGTSYSHGILFSDRNSHQAAIRAKRTDISSTYDSSLQFFTNSHSMSSANETFTDANARMTINHIGNVGIGVDNPAQKFVIKGVQSDTTASAKGVMNFIAEPDGYAGGTRNRLISSNDRAFIDYKTETGGRGTWILGTQFGDVRNTLAVHGDGNVGVGITAPKAKFQVGDANQAVTISNLGDETGMFNPRGMIGFNTKRTAPETYLLDSDGANNGGSFMYSTIHGDFHIGTVDSTGNTEQNLTSTEIADATVLTVSQGKRVGVGKKNPLVKLDVDGAVKIADTTSACDADRVGSMKYVPASATNDQGDFLGCVQTAGGLTTNDSSDDIFAWTSITGVVQ